MGNIAFRAGRIIRAIWRGPFFIGPHSQPISLGAALLRILEVIWKFGIAVLIAGAVALALAAVGALISRTLNPTLESQLAGEARFDQELCTKEFPIAVIIRNNSKRSLASARIDLVATQPGRSTNLVKYPSLDWGAIIQGGEAAALCYSLPSDVTDDPKTLDYSVKIWSATPQN